MTESNQGASPKARPILFSGPMVRALFEGRKTQTRRVVKPRLVPMVEECLRVNGKWVFDTLEYDFGALSGRPGDLLWVRETWRPFTCTASPGCSIDYRATQIDHSDIRWRPGIHMPRWASRLTLELTDVRVQRLNDISEDDAKAEGFQAGWMGPALPPTPLGDGMIISSPGTYASAAGHFQALWCELHGFDAWDADPWVWALSFKVHHYNVDKLAA
jgi:hypothetical protein